MSTRRRRREAYSTAPPAGGTTYTNAIRIAVNLQRAMADPHASYNNLSALTVALLTRYDGTSTGLCFGKASNVPAGWRANYASTTALDVTLTTSATQDFKRAVGVTADNSWQWLFVGIDRVNHLMTRSFGPMSGTIADIHRNVAGGGSGTPVDDSTFKFWIGGDGNGSDARIQEFRYIAIANSVLSLANMQAIANDALAQSALVIDYWKPDATSTTQCNSGKGILPPLIYTGATLV